MGTSGSGKTTLMNILGCLDRPTSGHYWLEGQDVTELSPDERALLRNQKLGFVFQTFHLLPRTSALENVIMPLSYNGINLSDGEARQQSEELLAKVGLGDRLDHEPSQLSGGQQQRVAIARALVNHPSILFADEPTGNLDSKTSEEMLALFKRLNAEGVTIVLVTHDEEVARAANRIIRIHDGMIQSDEAHAATVEAPEQPEKAGRRPVWALPRVRWMLRTALQGLRRNIMRAALTALGIIIGVAAVIAMMEIGRGSASAIQSTIASMGANNLLILPGTAASGGVTFGAGSIKTLPPRTPRPFCGKPRRCGRWPPLCGPGPRWCTATATGCPFIYTAPPRLTWTSGSGPWPRGTCSPSRMSATPARCASWAESGAGAVPGGVAPGQGNSGQQRRLQGHRRAHLQRGQYGGHRPGRRAAGALDHHQVPGGGQIHG
jgi:ABC-type lipoprotein export system ATPase subunit